MIRRHLARLIGWIAEPLCRGGCRQPVDRCACHSLPRLPDELFDD